MLNRVLFVAIAAAITGAVIAWPAPGYAPVAKVSIATLALTDGIADTPDPFPIRRVVVTPDQLDGILTNGPTFRRMPRIDLERRIKSAVSSMITASQPPKIIEAHYSGTLSNGALQGTATWAIAQPGGPGLLALDPLQIAISNATWKGDRKAMLTRLPTGNANIAAIWVKDTNDGVLSLEWSVRSIEEPGVERFDLVVPKTPVALLELAIPADRVLTAQPPGVLVTGPYPTADATRQTWRVAFGGLSKVELTVRHPGIATDTFSLARESCTSRYEIAPGEAQCEFAFEWEAIREPVSELAFDVDPGLRVLGVVTPRSSSWRLDTPTNMSDGPRIVVSNRNVAQNGRVTISAVADVPHSSSTGWTLPRIRVSGGIPGNHSVYLDVSPQLQILGLDPGDYRPVSGSGERGYQLSLIGSLGPNPSQESRKPISIRLRSAQSRYSTVEDIIWRPTPVRSTLTGRFRLLVQQGPLSQLVFSLPASYRIRSVNIQPDDPGLIWYGDGSGRWVVEPSKPFSTGQTGELSVELVGPGGLVAPDPAAVDRVPIPVAFPQIRPLGAVDREGTYTVQVPPGFRAWPTPTAAADGETASGLSVRPSGQSIVYAYRTRELDQTLYLGPRTPRVVATSDTHVTREGETLVATNQLKLRCESGSCGSVTLFLPTIPQVSWDIHTSSPVSSISLPLPIGLATAGATSWSQLGIAAVVQEFPGSFQKVQFSRPMQSGLLEIAVIARTPGVAEGSVYCAIPSVCGLHSSSHAISLGPTLAAKYDPPSLQNFAVLPGVVQLRPRDASPRMDVPVSREWQFDQSELTTQVGPDAMPLCRFRARVLQYGGRWLPLGLPSGAVSIDVMVNTHHVLPEVSIAEDSQVQLRIPLPPQVPDGSQIEVRYQLPSAPGLLVARFRSPDPTLPLDGPLSRKWLLAPSFRMMPDLAIRSLVFEDARTELFTVRESVVVASGCGLAAVLLGLVLYAAFTGRRRVIWFIACCSVSLLLAGWWLGGGWWSIVLPPIIMSLLAMAGFRNLGLPPRRPGQSTVNYPAGRPSVWIPGSSHSTSFPNVSPAIAWAMMLASVASAQAPEPVTVYLSPVATDPARYDAIVPQSVLDRLDSLVQPVIPGLSITHAEHIGFPSSESTATFETTLAVWSVENEPRSLVLPLSGVRLLGAWIDGQVGYPESLGGDRYAITVRGSGVHSVRLKYEVPVSTLGADRDVRLGIPDVPISQVKFTFPPGATRPDVPSRRGSQRVQGGQVEAQHGGGRTLSIRWQVASGGAAPVVSAKAACVWDLDEDEATATAVFQVRVESGSANRLNFLVPNGLAPGRVAVRLESRSGGSEGTGLRDWQIRAGPSGWQILDLGLQSPLAGKATVSFRLYPIRPLGTHPVLRFPTFEGADSTSDGLYAIRLQRVIADSIDRSGVIDVPPENLVKEFAAATELELDRQPLSRAFRQSPGATPELRAVLRPASGLVFAAADVIWTLGKRAVADGAVRVIAAEQPIVLATLDIPSTIHVQDVRVPDLVSWNRLGNSVQVWLRRPTREATIRWSGVLTGYQPDVGQSGTANVDLPLPAFSSGPSGLRIRAEEGWVVVPDQIRGLKAISGEPSPAGSDWLRYLVEPLAPAPRFRVYPPQIGRVAVTDSLNPGEGDSYRYRADLAVTVPPGRPSRFAVLLASAARATSPTLHVPNGVRVSGPTTTADGPTWIVSVADGGSVPIALELQATIPVGGTGEAWRPLPVVWFGQTPIVSQYTVLPAQEILLSPPVSPTSTEVGTPVPVSPPTPQPPSASVEDSPRSVRSDLLELMPLFAWLIGFGYVIRLVCWGEPGRWRPEQATVSGVLAIALVGFHSPVTLLCLSVVGIGVAFRFVWLARQVGKRVMR